MSDVKTGYGKAKPDNVSDPQQWRDLYYDHHQGRPQPKIPAPLRSNDMFEVLRSCGREEWDAIFLEAMVSSTREGIHMLYNVMKLSPHPDDECTSLLGCKIATMIKGKHLKDIKPILSPQAADVKDEAKFDEREIG